MYARVCTLAARCYVAVHMISVLLRPALNNTVNSEAFISVYFCLMRSLHQIVVGGISLLFSHKSDEKILNLQRKLVPLKHAPDTCYFFRFKHVQG